MIELLSYFRFNRFPQPATKFRFASRRAQLFWNQQAIKASKLALQPFLRIAFCRGGVGVQRRFAGMATGPLSASQIKHKQIFINNKFVNSVSGKTFPTYNPATEAKICDVQEADKADVDLAVEAATVAFKRNSKWRSMDATERAKILLKAAHLLDRDRAYISNLETMDTGKPLKQSDDDLQHTIDVFRYYAGAADKINGKTIPADGNYFAYTRCEALGVVGQITPWNYPLSLLAWKLAPALVCGNCCLVKPSELTPLSTLATAAILAEAGLPDGVLSVLPGYGPTAGAAMASHQDVRKIAFTGSTVTGKKIMEMAANSNLKKVTLELGGKSPIVIFPDCDLEQAVTYCNGAVMGNCGQNCCAGSRNYVHADIYDKFVKMATASAKNLVVGDPYKDGINNGTMISKPQMDKYLAYVKSGKDEGAKLQCGGKRIGSKGYFVEPAVFSDVTDNMKIAREEVFGPLQSILKFTDMEEVIDRCNDTPYGLAAGVFTKDVDRALYMAHNLKGGITWVNCADSVTIQTPFGGFKQSGFGKELGEDALKEYHEMKTVMVKVSKKNC